MGFLSNAAKKKRLSQARLALMNKVTITLTKAQRKEMAVKRIFGSVDLCPCCSEGQMHIIDVIAPNKYPSKIQGHSIKHFYINIRTRS